MKTGVGTILCLTATAEDWVAINANAKHNYKPSGIQEIVEYYSLEAQDLYTKGTDTQPSKVQVLAQDLSVLQTCPPKLESYWKGPQHALLNRVWDLC